MRNICALLRINSEKGLLTYNVIYDIINSLKVKSEELENKYGLPQSWLTLDNNKIKEVLLRLDPKQ